MEFLWHVVWGENGDPPLRQDDENLPLAFRLKFGVEHEKKEWNDVVLSPNVSFCDILISKQNDSSRRTNKFLWIKNINKWIWEKVKVEEGSKKNVTEEQNK